jgi:hypothetical protein
MVILQCERGKLPDAMAPHSHLKVSGTHRCLGTFLEGFTVIALVWFAFSSVPVHADPPSDIRTMSVKERTELGEKLVFGSVGTDRKQFAVGKAQCPLCHSFFKESDMADPKHYPSPPYGPHFFDNFMDRIEHLVASSEYRQRPQYTERSEAFRGSGIANSVIEYLAESNICPSCYVPPGFGMKDSRDHESPMPMIHKPPISLSLSELIALHTWLYVHGGKEPPSPDEIEKAYRKFIPESQWHELIHPPQ